MTKATAKPEFGAVRPDNLRRPATPRRDPDTDTTPPPPSTTPDGPGPTDPTPPPGPAPATPEAAPRPAAPHPAGAASAVAPADGGTLASVLTAPHHQRHPVSEGVAALAGLAAMRRRPVDPMQDWTGDGTRTPRWLSLAIRQYAQLTGRKTQEVQRDALLGVDPIPADVLDANWLDCYGFPREQYRPEDYR